jgi:hypothetical protein
MGDTRGLFLASFFCCTKFLLINRIFFLIFVKDIFPLMEIVHRIQHKVMA